MTTTWTGRLHDPTAATTGGRWTIERPAVHDGRGIRLIVITGVGRSGTSLIAAAYEQLGFSVGGQWVSEINAGLEDPEIMEANETIMSMLSLTGLRRSLMPPSVKRALKRRISRSTIQRTRAATGGRLRLPPGRHLHLLRWDRLPRVVEQLGPRLVELAAGRPVVKDPRFRYTLPVWLAAGTHIEHVLIALRNLDAAIDSKMAAGYESTTSRGELRNWLVYGLGLCLDTLLEHHVDHAMVRFPDFLEDPDTLFEAMRFPEPVDRDRFLEVFAALARPEMVHH